MSEKKKYYYVKKKKKTKTNKIAIYFLKDNICQGSYS